MDGLRDTMDMFEHTLGDNEGQGSLAHCCPWGRKESDMTEGLNNNENNSLYIYKYWQVYVLSLFFSIDLLICPFTSIPYDYTVEVRNRFKGLDLIDRVPDELWTKVRDIVQETGIKTIPMEKKCKKAKWL